VHPHGPLTALEEDLWWVKGSMPRLPLPRNMVVWRHPSAGLVIYNPVALDDAGMGALEALGDVRWVVAPCEYHRTDIGVFKERYPDAMALCPACATAATAKVTQPDGTLEEVFPGLGIEVVAPPGTKPYELHPRFPLASGGRAVVFTDLLMNLGDDPPAGFGGWLMRAVGSVKPLGITSVGRMMVLKQRAPFKAYVQSLADDPAVRMAIPLHGPPVVDDVSARLALAADKV
jgi:hypothetical protein